MKQTIDRYWEKLKVFAMFTASLGVALAQYDSSVASSNWPDEPTGFATITDEGFTGCTPTSCDGWGINQPPQAYNYSSQITDNTVATPPAFTTPNTLLQVMYPAGFPQGYEPVTMSYHVESIGQADIFVGFWWKPSNPWQGDTSNVNKINFIWHQADAANRSSQWITRMYGAPGGPYYLDLVFESNDTTICNFGKCGNYFPSPTKLLYMTLGQWHRVELLIHQSTTTTSQDGYFRAWLNGQLAVNQTGINTSTQPWSRYSIAPTWGGCCGGTKTETDYFWYDNVHISTGSSSNAPPPAAPTGLIVK